MRSGVIIIGLMGHHVISISPILQITWVVKCKPEVVFHSGKGTLKSCHFEREQYSNVMVRSQEILETKIKFPQYSYIKQIYNAKSTRS